MATGAKRGRKPSTPSKSGKKMITKRCSTAGKTLKTSKRPVAKSRAGRTLGGKC